MNQQTFLYNNYGKDRLKVKRNDNWKSLEKYIEISMRMYEVMRKETRKLCIGFVR